MAPSGPRSGVPPGANGTARGTFSTTRGTGRGSGIQKRRSGTPRVDSDGDMVMNAAKSAAPAHSRSSANASTASRGGRAMTRAAARKVVNNVVRALGTEGPAISSRVPGHLKSRSQGVVIKIHGIKDSKAASNADGGEKGLLQFIERKANKDKTVTIKKSVMVGDYVYIMVSEDDVTDVLRLNDFTYAGAKLTFAETKESWPTRTTNPSLSKAAKESKGALLEVLSRRYNPELKLLDLSALGRDETLVQMGFFEGQTVAEKAFKALLVVAEQQFPTPAAKNEAIRSVSLAHNGINHVAQVFELADVLPELTGLDLSENGFDSLRKLGRWRYRFKHLETLLLNGNPLEANEPNFAIEVMDWWPKLKILNNAVVRTQEEIDAKIAAHRPQPISQRGSDFRDEGSIGEQFLTQFIPMYDSDRAQLASLFYDQESCFSVAIVTHSPRDTNSTPVLPWHSYIRFSRNMTKITSDSARVQRLFKGSQSISELWKTLPPTKHPDLKTEFNKYIIDCHPLNGLADPNGAIAAGVGGMVITIHGEFEEADSTTNQTGKRSFTRSVVLGPGKAGQQPVRVVSDMLSLRAWNPLPDINTALGNSPEVLEQAQKQRKVMELSKRSGMTSAYSELCLGGVNWSLDQALVVFESNRANLPAEAWAVSTASNAKR